MSPPKIIYLQVCGSCQDNECDKCDFNDLSEVTWCKDRINNNDVAYFSEQAIRDAGFAILNQVCKSLDSNYGICINSTRITEDIIQVLKGGNND